MTFLPIVDRELRLAARRRGTYRIRVAAAVVTLIIGGAVLLTVELTGTPSARAGQVLFGMLTWMSFAAVASAGLFFTSDCLSEEKREGTLGLLFLTDLRGYDVVLGKLLSTSLRTSHGLLAIFPILAITLLMGGVTGPQFWETSLALVNALFFSLSGGLFVSALNRDSQKALMATLLFLLTFFAAGPVMDGIMAASHQKPFEPTFSLASPGYIFVVAGRGGAGFWTALLTNQLAAWLLLAAACALVPRTWQEKAAKTSPAILRWSHWWKYGGTKRRAALRRKLLGANPVMWLACRERWQSVLVWVTALVLLGACATLFAFDLPRQFWMAQSYLGGALALLLYAGISSQAGRFFVEARRNGLLELLVAVPLSAREIVQGPWRAMQRMFGAPLVLFLAAMLGSTFMAQQWSRQLILSAPATTVTRTNGVTVVTSISGNTTTITTTSNRTTRVSTQTTAGAPATPNASTALSVCLALAASVAGIATIAANLIALAWFGLWMGLTSKSAHLATLQTLVFVQVLPWLVMSFASTMIVALLMLPAMMRGTIPNPANLMVWFPFLSAALTAFMSLTKDFFFWRWARKKLYSEFRERAAGTAASIRPVAPQSVPRSNDTPPGIASTSSS